MICYSVFIHVRTIIRNDMVRFHTFHKQHDCPSSLVNQELFSVIIRHHYMNNNSLKWSGIQIGCQPVIYEHLDNDTIITTRSSL